MDKNRSILREAINKAVKNALFETKQKQEAKRLDTIVENVVSKKLRTLKEDDSIANKRNIVNTWLHDPKVNKAEVRRELEGEPETQKEEDAKRSYFIQRLNQTNGKEFSDEDIAELYAIKNNSGQ
jgi:hypothetical protein